MTDPITLGLPRSYFYKRIADALHEVIQRNTYGEDRQPEMVAKVNIQEALDRIQVCPVCGHAIQIYEAYPLERSCGNDCGEFTITEVWGTGDVTFEFKMTAPERMLGDDPTTDEPV